MDQGTSKKETLHFFGVPTSELEAFSATLILGTLEAMRSGVWSLDAGIWTLGRSKFRLPLEQAGVCEELAEVLRVADELSAIAELCGREQADLKLDQLIAQIRRVLAAHSVHFWCVGIEKK